MTHSARDQELAAAQARAARIAARAMPKGADGTHLLSSADASATLYVNGTMMSEVLKHGGLYTLTDREMTRVRMAGAMMTMGAANAPPGLTEQMAAVAAAAMRLPTFFFYHLVPRPYPLSSQIVSYLTHPARHLSGPIGGTPKPMPTPTPSASIGSGPPSAAPYALPGKTYTQTNNASVRVPAAATFIGQFIDHDLTLNAMNLLSPQLDPSLRSQASPLIDLDSVYGPRLDDPASAMKQRLIPMSDYKFRLSAIQDSAAYDVCRDKDPKTGAWHALIGDKRNDENQLILQVHIAAMRLHNYFMQRRPGATPQDFAAAKRQTILHWQAMVATYYLPLVAREDAIIEVKRRLFDAPDTLCHRKGQGTLPCDMLGMPHEFAIGFRFGHSQLRSEYTLRKDADPIRLFDPLVVRATHDLTGDKWLTKDHCIDWNYFTDPKVAHSNLIDAEVNEVVFALPESTIPDDVKLVNNLPLRNLIRSNDIGLCAGEDLAHRYEQAYPTLAGVLTNEQVDRDLSPVFSLSPCEEFRTPLWYYLLKEAEADGHDGRLGKVGSLLVAEVILSGIKYAMLTLPDDGTLPPQPDQPCSIFEDPVWASLFRAWSPPDQALKTFVELVDLGNDPSAVPPTCEQT